MAVYIVMLVSTVLNMDIFLKQTSEGF